MVLSDPDFAMLLRSMDKKSFKVQENSTGDGRMGMGPKKLNEKRFSRKSPLDFTAAVE